MNLLKDKFKYLGISTPFRENGIVLELRSRTMRVSKFPNDFRIEPWKEF